MKLPSEFLRDFVVDGVPSSGSHETPKQDFREYLDWARNSTSGLVDGVIMGGAVVYSTRALLYADLLHASGKLGIVYNDSTAAYNGVYVKAGSSGSGSWSITNLALPAAFAADLADAISDIAAIGGKDNVRLFGVAGTNAITAYASGVVVSDYVHGQIFLFQPVANNTGNVTLKVGSLAALPLRDPNGAEIDPGGLVSGRTYAVRTVGSTPITELRIQSGDLGTSHRLLTKITPRIISNEASDARFTTTPPTAAPPSGHIYVTKFSDVLKFAKAPDGSYISVPLFAAAPEESGVLFGAGDADGNIGFSLRRDGKLFARLSTDSVVPGSALERNVGPESGYVGGYKDDAGNIAIGIKPDGSVRLRLSEDSEIPAGSYGASIAVPSIAAWGDSLTFGSGGSGTTWPGVVASALGRTVYNGGVSSETSSEIRDRQEVASTYFDHTVVFWVGRNNYSARATVRDDILAMIDNLSPNIKHVLVGSVLNGNYTGERAGGGLYDDIMELNAELALTFGGNFIDIRRYLIDFGLAEAGISPVAQDVTDISQDLVPVSLRSDNIHLNAAGYTVVGNFIARNLIARGY